MPGKLKVAVVGASGYGDQYLSSLLGDPRRDEIEFVGVADPSPQRCRRLEALRAVKVPFYPSIDILMENVKHLDLMMMATPIHFHAPHACMAMDRGMNVLCEKPLAGSLADAKRMMQSEQAASVDRRFLAIGYQWSFSAAIQELKRDILAGVFGKAKRFRCIASFPRGQTYFNRNDWAGRVRTGKGEDVLDSPVNNATAHYLHNMLYLLGETRETSATPATLQSELYRANPIENYDTAALRIHTTRGAEILFYTTHAMPERVGPVSVYEFEHGTITHDAVGGGYVADFTARMSDGSIRKYGNPDVNRNSKIWQCLDAIRGGLPPACTVMTAMPHMLCALAAHVSCPVITTISARHLVTSTAGDDVMISVRGLDRVLRESFELGVMPAELSAVDWTWHGERVDVPHVKLLRGMEAVAST